MTLKQRLNKFLTAGIDHKHNIFLLRQLVLVTSLLTMIIFLFSFFTLYNFAIGDTVTALLDLSGLIIVLTAMYQIQRHKRLNLAINIVVSALFVFLLVFSNVNQNMGYGLVWTFFFPLFTVLLKGHRTGTIIVICFYVLLLTFAFRGIGTWQSGAWDLTSFIRFSLASLVFYYVSYFNELSLQRSYTELQETRRREQEAAEQYNQAMEQILNNKQQLMMDISHELRTPLAAMRVNVEAMEDGVTDPKEGYLLLYRKLGQMNQLIEDIYQLSKADIEALNFVQEPVQLHTLLTEVCNSFAQPAQETGLTLTCDIDPSQEVIVLGDDERLYQLFANLLQNSLNYTESGGTLELTAHKQDQYLEITIQDSEPGVTEEHLPKLFDRFYRVDKSRSRATGGSGLGLSICKVIVEHHDGQITATASPLGGLKINILLPLAK